MGDLEELEQMVQSLKAIERSMVSVDLSHAALIYGLAVSGKPNELLELGIGSGLTAFALHHATRFNLCGQLTVVDNYFDWGGGDRPSIADKIAALDNVRLVESSEREFLANTPDNSYDFLLSDADHYGDWQDQHLRVVRPNGTLVFHDTNNPEFPNLLLVEEMIKARRVPYKHYTLSSRPEERCERGLLVAFP